MEYLAPPKTNLRVCKRLFFKHNIDIQNILSCATDGAPAMIGKFRGSIGLLKKWYPATLAINCVVHRQHLVAKLISDKLNVSLQYVMKAVNTIKSKQQALNTKMFRELCKDNDKGFETLVMYTEIRWLSKFPFSEYFFYYRLIQHKRNCQNELFWQVYIPPVDLSNLLLAAHRSQRSLSGR